MRNERHFRVIGSAIRGDWVVAHEIAAGQCKTESRTSSKPKSSLDKGSPDRTSLPARTVISVLVGILFAASPVSSDAQSLDIDKVVHGEVAIQAATHTTITQNSSKAIIDWKNFSVGTSESLTFVQPSRSAIALNRITGASASHIDGLLNANGQVWVLNPNGVMIGKSGQINAAGFLASTMAISNEDFIAGKYQFTIPTAASSARVVNLGSINAPNGYAILSGSQVSNEGVIQASLGQVVLAAGNAMTLDLVGDRLLSFAITQPVSGLPADGKAAIENVGRLSAQGGRVLVTARAAADMMQSVINTTGIVEATSARMVNGEIVLDGGSSGRVSAGGELTVSGLSGGETGGAIKVFGESVDVLGAAKLMARGDAGGGHIYVGGGWQGQRIDGYESAVRVSVGPGAEVNASAIDEGKGGTIVLWSDVGNPKSVTHVSGTLKAEAGVRSGDGGRIETSGRTLRLDGLAVSTRAPVGKLGLWLIDPVDYVFDTADDVAAIWNDANNSDVAIAGQNIYVNTGIYSSTNSTKSLVLTASATASIKADISVGGNLTVSAKDIVIDGSSNGNGLIQLQSAGSMKLTGDGTSGSVSITNASLYSGAAMDVSANTVAINYITPTSVSLAGTSTNLYPYTSLESAGDMTISGGTVSIANAGLFAGSVAGTDDFAHDLDLSTLDPSTLEAAVTSRIALAGDVITLTGDTMIGATGALTLGSGVSGSTSITVSGSTLLSIGDLSVVARAGTGSGSGVELKDAALLTKGSLTLDTNTLTVAGSTFAYANQLTLPSGFVRPSTLSVYDLSLPDSSDGGSSSGGSPGSPSSGSSSGSSSGTVSTAPASPGTVSITEVRSSDSRLASLDDSAASTLGSLTSTLGTSVAEVVDTIAKEGAKAVLAIRADLPVSPTPSASPLLSTPSTPAQTAQSPASGSKSDAAADSTPAGSSSQTSASGAPSASSAPQAAASAPSPASPATPSAAAPAAPATPAIQTSAAAATANAPPPVAPPPPSPVAAEKPPTPKDSADAGDKTLAAAAPPPPPKPASQARAPATQVVAVSPVVSTQMPLPPRPPAGTSADQRVPATGNSARW